VGQVPDLPSSEADDQFDKLMFARAVATGAACGPNVTVTLPKTPVGTAAFSGANDGDRSILLTGRRKYHNSDLAEGEVGCVESRKGAGPGPTGSRWFPFPAHQTGRAQLVARRSR
jgi:hypothetical protein